MPVIDVDKLLQPVSPDAPCGENLEYDAVFLQMEQAATPKPDQQFGDTVVPGEEPEWREVKKLGLELLEPSRDLRVLSHLSRALLKTDGLPGFRDAVVAMQRLVAERWESVHPQLDPDDGNDPTLRVNLIAELCDGVTTLKYLRDTPLVQARTIGRFSLRDYDIATGEIPAPPRNEGDPELPKLDTLQAAFRECELDGLQADAAAVHEALEGVIHLEASLTEQVGAAQSTSLDPLRRVLKRMTSILDEQLERRGVRTSPEAPVDTSQGNGASANGSSMKESAMIVVQGLSGDVTTRDDVLKALDKVCEYYARYEPSSPVPILLKRAKRLAGMSFLEIVRDLSPEALKQVMALGGEESESG